jgi:hypothetical protein
MSVGILYNSLIRYYGPSITVPGAGLPLTVDSINFYVDSTMITADATVTP